ncbi:type I-F CRISPR-associated protein Csy1 [Acinetobacter sp. TTH0-4]|uniref:type I-F CRISPR-associated protein Csy1 n=1 Tax=Acinetobacter sp. TTH0-4 TaxID=1646498 RepID=UPI00189F29EA|nr:type I-F CRISPR-associated protein Csy1 [Acinetobacter sp. TTH0-4]QPF37198.1 type I-F CRISPR-associated protein Csy1 [Acinetobacter sp. TTH0-4]
MIEQVFSHFLHKQKSAWLERKSKGKEPTSDLVSESEIRYEKNTWLAKAVKQARYAITTHASTFTHPDAKTSCFLFESPRVKNGFLITNNVQCQNSFDLFGNAATDSFVKEIYLFLIEPVQDQKIWDYFANETDEIKKFIELFSLDFNDAKNAFSKLMIDPEAPKTHRLLKQVYFPVNEQYHLLSLLTPSIVTTEFLNRVNRIKFSESSKEARVFKKENKFHEHGFEELFDLTEIAFGGSKPQNVSVLNSQNAGRAYLLSSAPPQFEKRTIRLPKNDFFAQCLYRKNFQDSFLQLHKLMQLDVNNNINTRTAIRNIIQFVIDQVMFQAFKIRQSYAEGWSNEDYYVSLPKLQRVWLDDFYENEREQDNEWRDELSREIARWILRSYEKSIEDSFTLGTGELIDVKQRVEKSLQQTKEFF